MFFLINTKRMKNARLSLTIEELDDVREVHVIVQDDVPVVLYQGQGQKEEEMGGGHVFGTPDGLPSYEHVIVHQLWGGGGKISL